MPTVLGQRQKTGITKIKVKAFQVMGSTVRLESGVLRASGQWGYRGYQGGKEDLSGDMSSDMRCQ